VPPHCLSSAWLVTTQALFLSFALPPEQSMKRLFEAFYTIKPEGMGVSISRSIIEAHGGRLWPAANDDYGATLDADRRPSRWRSWSGWLRDWGSLPPK
jgi:hypothetical protein